MLNINAKRKPAPPRPEKVPEIQPPRFNKGVLSQSIHTKCELALYLSLFKEETLGLRGLPVPLPARPGVSLIKDAGIGFETLVYEALLDAFPDHVLCAREMRPTEAHPDAVRWEERELRDYLEMARRGTWLIAQSAFTLGPRPVATLRRLGVGEAAIARMPTMGKVVPDLLAVRPGSAGTVVVQPDGSRSAMAEGDARQVLTVIDAKHASEPNPSYEAEVVLYALLLSNWLREMRLDRTFAVSAGPLLWTRGGDGLDCLATVTGSLDARVGKVLEALEGVNIAIHTQGIRRFFAEALPEVLDKGDADWLTLDWHVGPSCNTCDFLGHKEWLSNENNAKVDAAPSHYCMSRAAQENHLSRVPGLTKGAAKALRQCGVPDVSSLVGLPPSHHAFRGHTSLVASRRVLPEVARSLEDKSLSKDRLRVDGMLPPRSDLTLFVGIDFDGGAGLLTGLSLRWTFFRPRDPNLFTPGAAEGTKPLHQESAYVVERKTKESERVAVLGFLNALARVLAFATDTGEHAGGKNATRSTAVVVMWSQGQYDALCQALGRHLGAILGNGDGPVRALAWLFPGDSLQGRRASDERHPAIVLLRNVSRRLVRTPTVHSMTLASLVDTYRLQGKDPVLPHPYYVEPFTDGIPRERIYEIWAMEDDHTKLFSVYQRDPTGRVMREAPREEKRFTRTDFVDMYERALKTQANGLESITRHLRKDFADQLKARAPRIVLNAPTWSEGVAFDAKLWIARAEFEAAHERHACLMRYLSDPDEAEASYEALRLKRLVETLPDGSMVYEIEEGSRDAKLREGAQDLCLSFESHAGFAATAAWSHFGKGELPKELGGVARRRMHAVFEAVLVRFDRTALRATVLLKPPGGKMAEQVLELRDLIVEKLGLGFERGLSLMPSMPPDVTVRRLSAVMAEVGDPPSAVPDGATCGALGISEPPLPGASAPTPMSRVLWDAAALEREAAMPEHRVAVALAASAGVGLDASQASAVATALRRRLTVIWGPPGTGKTATLQGFLHGLVHEANAHGGGTSILVTGPTYKAVGEVAFRLLKGLAKDASAPATVVLLGAADRPMLPLPVPDVPHVRVIETPADAKDHRFRDAMATMAAGGVVVVCAITHQCARLSEQRSDLLDDGGRRMLHPMFDTIVIDEASQVDMATAAFPLALMKDGARIVVAGDHLQMPPVQAIEPPKGAERLVGSIQTYLVERFGIERTPLLVNYRSNTDIVGYCRGLGYPPALTANFGEARINALLDPRSPFLPQVVNSWKLPWSKAIPELLDPSRGLVALTYPDGMAGQANAYEACIVASIVMALRACSSRALDNHPDDGEAHGEWDDVRFFQRGIGIVTPHRAQKARVVAALCAVFPAVEASLIEDAVDTVERFQGGQRHTVLISFGVGDPDVIQGEERFLMSLERTNVAISRAMAKCIVVMSDQVATHIPSDRTASRNAHALRGVVDDWCRHRATHPVTGIPESRNLTARWK